MANANSAFGLKPVRYASGAPYNGACNRYFVPASDGTALYDGDPVIINGTGDAYGVPGAIIATAAGAGRITGVVVGFEPLTTPTTPLGYRAASTACYILVADDPNLLFEIQEDAVGGALAVTDIGLNADLIAGTGSTYTKRSGWQLDTSTKATTATLQLRIDSFQQRVDNEVGANAKVLVRINLPTQTGAAGSTGV
jgi:hypothetical protein